MARELKGEKLEKELLRLEEMKAYEKENAQYELICGIDEAGKRTFSRSGGGRGCYPSKGLPDLISE